MTTTFQIHDVCTRARRSILSILSGVGLALACDVGPRDRADDLPERDSATLVMQMSIGENIAASADDQFSAIVAMLVTDDEKLWVVDGFNGPTPQVRIYDDVGRFHRRVGNIGSGPGEYRNPNALAMLADGRVVLRDQNLADRLTVYTSAGTVDTTWSLGARYTPNGPDPRMVVDTSGSLWVSIGSRGLQVRFRGWPIRSQGHLRVRDGAIIDTVRLPPLPELSDDCVTVEKRLPSGGLSVRGACPPFQPQAVWALDRRGRFAIARTDQYRIEILPPHGSPNGTPSTIVSRDARPILVSEDERAFERERLIDILTRMSLPTRRVPEIPRSKPPIQRLYFSSDGQLIVRVSVPSSLVNGEWVESTVHDVFDKNGRFRGRVHIPDGFSMGYLKDDELWGVWRDEDGVESIRRYKIRWRELQSSLAP